MDAKTVVTGEVRFSFVHVFEPYAFDTNQEAKYSLTLLVPKTDTATVAAIQAAIAEAKDQGVDQKWQGRMPAVVAVPVYDGDGVRPNGEPFGPECKGHYVFTASAKADRAPEVVGPDRMPITRHSDIYSGCYGKVCVNFFPYSNSGKKGIGAGLGPVMKTRDGEPLGGSAPSAASVFGAPEGSAASVFGSNPVQGSDEQPRINPLTGQLYR